ncbi:hypothetical protein C8R44DRAFT_744073 [Mycena epipterygia]|nr:hypothetical protein C8R44DRAFT_744073 [Mycena epipterygia]
MLLTTTMFFLRPVPLSAHSLSSSLKSISHTVVPIRTLTCTAPCASQAHPVNCLSGHFASACLRPVRCHICKGEGHIASACSTPILQSHAALMNMAASTVVGPATPPRFAPCPSSAVRAVVRATDMVFYYPSMNYNKYQGGSKGAKDQEESHLEATHDGPEVWVLAEARQRLALTDVSDKVG